MSKLTDQIKAYNQALQNKTWQGDWSGGGENAITEAAKQLEKLGVKDIQTLKVEKNIERLPVATLYNGQPIQTDPATGRKFYNAQENIGGFTDNWEYATVRKYIPSNAPLTYAKLVDVQVGTGDNVDYVSQLVPLTAEEKATYDPVTSTYGKLAGNKLVDTSTNKTIATSSGNNFIINKYDTGNFFKGKDKSFGFLANEQGEVVPYQTSEKSGLVNSPVFPVIMAMIAPGVGGLIGGATGLAGTSLNVLTGATLGAGTAALTDQDVLKGAIKGAAGAGVGAYAGDVGKLIGITDPTTAKIIGGALIKGTATAVTGGDFLDGAISGALSGTGQKIGETIGLEGSVASSVGTSITNGVIASVQGKDVSDAMINGAISGYLGYKEPKQVIEEVEAEQLAGPTDEEPFVPSVDQQTLNEVKESIQDEEVVSAEQTVQTQEEMQLSNDELLAELAPYEVPEIQEMVITAPREQTVLTQEEMQPSIDELTTELAPYEQPYIPTIDEETAQEEVVKEDEELTQLAGPTDEEPIDATEKEGSLAKETEITPAPVDYKKLLSLAGNLITGAGIYTGVKSLASRPPITVTPPSSTTVTTPAVADEDIYKDAPIKGFSMRPDASGRYIPYIGEKAQLAKGGFISKKTKKSGLASRR